MPALLPRTKRNLAPYRSCKPPPVTINAEDELSVTISDGAGRTVASGIVAQDGTPISWPAKLAVAWVAGYNGVLRVRSGATKEPGTGTNAHYLHVSRDHHSDVLRPSEHNPPHFHAYYNEFKATFSIESLDLMEGDLPRRQLRLVQAWAELYQDELRADWQLAMNGEEPFRIQPLQ